MPEPATLPSERGRASPRSGFSLVGPLFYHDLVRQARRGRIVWLWCAYAVLLFVALRYTFAKRFPFHDIPSEFQPFAANEQERQHVTEVDAARFGGMLETLEAVVEQVVVADVGNPDYQNAHPSLRAMNHARGDVNDGSLAYGMLHAVEAYGPLAIQNVVQLRAALVVVLPGAVDIHGMGPGRDVVILAADEKIPPPAGGAFARGLAFVPDEQGKLSFRSGSHCS